MHNACLRRRKPVKLIRWYHGLVEKKVGRENLHPPSSVKVPHGWTISARQQPSSHSTGTLTRRKQDQTSTETERT